MRCVVQAAYWSIQRAASGSLYEGLVSFAPYLGLSTPGGAGVGFPARSQVSQTSRAWCDGPRQARDQDGTA
jgi:hypothetical protein